ncbi:DUF1697 domain-containing protein [Pelagovum pacificum]|uniref:DUF1697 domain-containing protein n=1 Tax=Pelagovum pacificum TaxID=2588711 RepID=A0A5C5GED2_9RHOB|nr:DUF1697 domain-containing protein [Pelagovum pacificum]QQA44568.1 DUF1697 domain-containing protein [Pelagovum pacificum]TNY32319.1 DUF1697 domain-containing protein [Pelagovum pacificum]
MTVQVALLRAINVGGRNKVPMATLRGCAKAIGWQDVHSYIATGNLVFRAGPGDHATTLRSAVRDETGVDPDVLVMTGAELKRVLEACPFDPEDGRLAHVYFCFDDPVIDEDLLDRFRSESERLLRTGRVIYLDAPDGIGRSKLVERFDKVVTGTATTGRNLRTIRQLVAMVDAKGA